MEWEDLARAAIDNAEDHATLEYLMRCGQRLRKGHAAGYFLQDTRTQVALHFLWVAPYDGFQLSEINTTLESKDPGAAMIYDCWTPVSQRGHGWYTAAIRLAADHLQKQQKRAWIFSAAKNAASVRGIVAAGFEYRYSMLSRKTPFGTTLSQRGGSARNAGSSVVAGSPAVKTPRLANVCELSQRYPCAPTLNC